ncbi:hypothetical protein DV453_002532 [Geotrichum candidum]|nr:hypothetical protein DV453_002532 [Geotrichum candidum]
MSDPTTIQLNKLLALLPDILKETEYTELYGYNLTTLPDTPAGTVIRDRLLTKFLVGNKFVVNDAAAQLKKTLAWRRDFNPLAAAFSETHNPEFEKLGIITSVPFPKAKIEPTKSAAPSPSAAASSKPATTSDAAADETTEKDPKSEETATPVATEAKEPAEPATAAETAEADAEAAKVEVTEPVTEPVSEATPESTEATEAIKATEAPEATEAAEAAEAAETTEATDKAAASEVGTEVTPASTVAEHKPQLIMNWNLYGAVKNRQQLFSDLDGFIRWRVGLMERAISLLDFSSSETSYIAQLHDYNNVSFLFLDSPTKAASKATIELFQNYYPEFLNVKYFVNIPIVMSWLFSFVKMLVAKETVDKFRVVSNGADLARTAGNWVPKQYGGKADSLEEIAVKQFVPNDAALINASRPEKKVAPKPAPEAQDKEASATAAEEPTATTTAAPAEPTEEVTEEPTETVAAKVAEPKTAEPVAEAAEVVDPKTSEPVEAAEPVTAEPIVVTAEPIAAPLAKPAVAVTTEPVEPTATPVPDAVEATPKPITAA